MKCRYQLVIIRGLPGSGKSTISSKLSDIFGLFIIDPDLLDDKDSKILKSERVRKYNICLSNATELINDNKNVLWDQPWRRIERLETALKQITNLVNKKLDILVIDIRIPIELSWERSKNKFNCDRKIFDEYVERYEMIPDDFSINKLVINGTDVLDANIKTIVKVLEV